MRAVRSQARGEATFRMSSSTEYKRSGLSMAKKVEPSHRALKKLQYFFSEKVILLFDFLMRFGCQFADLRNSLISLALGPPTSSVPGVATLRAPVNPRTFKARGTCCWCGSYSIPHCHNINVLPKKLTVQNCGDPGPNVTTLLSSLAPCNKLRACFRPSHRPTIRESSPCTKM